MPKVLVLFHSRTGSTAALADAVAEGAGSVKFTEVEVRWIDDPTPASETEANDETKGARAALTKRYRPLESVESLTQYDALIIGSPVRHGVMSEAMKRTLDQARASCTHGAFVDKVGSAFAPAAADERDASIMSMLTPMMHLGMILVPPGSAGSPGADALAMARQQGARVAKVAEWVRHAKSHEAHGHRH